MRVRVGGEGRGVSLTRNLALTGALTGALDLGDRSATATADLVRREG